jgi:hypothetical protein
MTKGDAEHMKWSALLIVSGGMLAAVAFFLPFYLRDVGVSVFGPGVSLLEGMQDRGIAANLDLWCEPVGALLLIVFGGLAGKLGRLAVVGSLSGAVLGLTFLLLFFATLYGVGHAFDSREGVGVELQSLGSGYWLAAIGYVLGCIGVLLGWRDQPAGAVPAMPPTGVPTGERALRSGQAQLLVVGGGLALLLGFFLAPFFNDPPPENYSLFGYLIRQGNPFLFFFLPEPLAAILLLGLARLPAEAGSWRIWEV